MHQLGKTRFRSQRELSPVRRFPIVGPLKRMKKTMSDCEKKSDLLYKEHLFQTFLSLKFIKSLEPMSAEILSKKRVSLKKPEGYEDKKTMVFDLDQTLIHCTDVYSSPVNAQTVRVHNKEIEINVRPHAKECLQAASKLFEVIVFTASHQKYADAVLDLLDPEQELIHHRLYRHHCIMVNGTFVKDLRILGHRELKDVVIVDNATYSFGYQLENGVPIVSWNDDSNDVELYNLIDYLEVLAEAEDVRDVNRKTFRLHSLYDDYLNDYLLKSA